MNQMDTVAALGIMKKHPSNSTPGTASYREVTGVAEVSGPTSAGLRPLQQEYLSYLHSSHDHLLYSALR